MIQLLIGTCHWKYPSWVNLVYSQPRGINYLEEYAAKYSTVEIDQWFWSLFKEDHMVLPAENTVQEYLTNYAVIRLHGPHRGEIEKQAQKKWDKIIVRRDEELKNIVQMINDMLKHNIEVFLNVNNHYEGSSPLTIERIRELLAN